MLAPTGGQMAAHWMWWILGVVLIGAELLTGTFYFFALGLAFLACGAIAWLGATLPVQLIAASILGLIGVYAAHHWRQRRGTPPAQPGLDIGQSVVVDRWQPDGTARVTYRGTQWTAELARPDVPRQPTMYIVDTRGSTLVLDAQRPGS
jgi:membrane protein implicated in regulation of membrane protease activity